MGYREELEEFFGEESKTVEGKEFIEYLLAQTDEDYIHPCHLIGTPNVGSLDVSVPNHTDHSQRGFDPK